MSYCIECGNKLESSALFCTACGKAAGGNLELGMRKKQKPINRTGLMVWSWFCLILFWPLALYNMIKLSGVHKIDSEEELRKFYHKIEMSCVISSILGGILIVGNFAMEIYLILTRTR